MTLPPLFITASAAITCFGNELDTACRRMREGMPPSSCTIDEKTYHAFREKYGINNDVDETGVLAVALVERMLETRAITPSALTATPVIIANSKGGMRAFTRYMNTPETRPQTFLFDIPPWNTARYLTERYGLKGVVYSLQSACSSSLAALASGMRLLYDGYARALVITVESSDVPLVRAGFQNLGVLAKGVMRPFGKERDGFVMGEGGSAVLLSRAGAGACAEVEKVVLRQDVTHYLRFNATGTSIADAVRALRLAEDDVDLIVAHGTGTKNDRIEDAALADVFGTRTRVTGLKPYIGHMLGASGLTELVMTLATLERGFIPHLPASVPLDACMRSSIVTKPVYDARIMRFVKLAYGFGGSIAAASVRRVLS